MPELEIRLKAEDYQDFKKYCERRIWKGRLLFAGLPVPVSYLMGMFYQAVNPGVTPLSGPITGIAFGYWAYTHYHRLTRTGKNTKKARRLLISQEFKQIFGIKQDKILEKIIEIIDEIPNPLMKQTSITRYLINKGRLDEAMQSAENYSRLKKELKLRESLYDKEIMWMARRAVPIISLFRKKGELYYAFLGQTAYVEGMPDLAEKRMQKAIDKNPKIALELNILAGNFAEIYERPETAIRRYQKAVRIIESRPDLKDSFRRVGEQRNESMLIKSKLVDGALHVKRGKNLKHEVEVNNFVYKALESYADKKGFGSDFICVARSLGFLENFNGMDYHFTRRRGNGNLEDAIMREPENADESIRKAVDSLIKVSALTTASLRDKDSLREYDYESEFERRVIGKNNERIGINDYLKKLKERWFGLLREAAVTRREQLVFSHCDAGPTNILPDGTVIDFEFAGNADPTFDPVSIKERSLREFTAEDMKHMLEAYRRYGLESFRDIEMLAMINKAHTTMTEYGTAIHRGRDERARTLLERSVIYLEMLQKGLGMLFKDYTTHSPSFAATA